MRSKNRRKGLIWFVVGGTLTVAGTVLIQPIIKKFGNQVYRRFLNNDEINFDNMGPQILPFTNKEKEDN